MTRLFIGLLLFIVIALATVSIYLKLSPEAISPNSTAEYNNAIAANWTSDLLKKHPYTLGSFSGVQSIPGNQYEVWITGRMVKDKNYDPKMIGVEIADTTLFARLSDNPVYYTQTGDQFGSDIEHEAIDPNKIMVGDSIAVRATYLDNFILVTEVRLLTRSK